MSLSLTLSVFLYELKYFRITLVFSFRSSTEGRAINFLFSVSAWAFMFGIGPRLFALADYGPNLVHALGVVLSGAMWLVVVFLGL